MSSRSTPPPSSRRSSPLSRSRTTRGTPLRAQTAFDWFIGRNRLNQPLYDFATGGCSDGLGAETTNHNEGAESTLAVQQSALLLDAAGLPAVLRDRSTELAAA